MATGTATVARNELFNVAEDAFYGFKSTRKEPDRQRMLAAATRSPPISTPPARRNPPTKASSLKPVLESGGRENVAGSRLTDPGQPTNGTPRTFADANTGTVRPPRRTAWIDQRGNPVHCLARGERLVDVIAPVPALTPADLSIGRLIVAARDGSLGPRPVGSASACGKHPRSGAVLVPNAVAAQIIDKARARTVVLQAGAQTIPMTSESMTIARVSTDATFTTKTYGEKWTQTDMAFVGVGLDRVHVRWRARRLE